MAHQIRGKGGMLLGALVSGALAAGTLTGAPAANASCISAFGLGNSVDCTSNLTSIAIAIGTGAQAHATGLFGSAFAVGLDSQARTYSSLSAAVAVGFTGGVLYTNAVAGSFGRTTDFANFAFALGNESFVTANTLSTGSGALALALGEGNLVDVSGSLSSAISIGGNQPYINNRVKAVGFLNSAFTLGGNKNTVTAGPGPFALAGSIGQNNTPVIKVGPGFAVGTRVGGAAAVKPKSTAPTATAVGTGNKIAASAAATNTRTQKAARAATATGRGKR